MSTAIASGRGFNVHVIDDDDSFRVSVTRVLNASGLKAIGYRCAGEFLLSDSAALPGCVLLDVCMPGPSGIELMDALSHRESAPPVIFVTGCSDVQTSVHAMKSGAVDFLTKPFSDADLMAAIRTAIEQDRRNRSERAELGVLRQRYLNLTAREREVLPLVVSGLLNKQAAAELGISEVTLQIHRRNVMEKMASPSLADLVRIAERLGIPVTHSRRRAGR